MAPNGEVSSSEVVAAFLGTLDREGRKFISKDELEQLRPALEDLYGGLIRVRQMGPEYRTIDFSEQVWSLMSLVGKRVEPVGARKSMLSRIAASFFTL